MQQNHPFSLYGKQDPGDTLIKSASDFPKSRIHFSHHGHPDRPAILNRLNIATDRLLVLFTQTLQARTNRLISRFRSVKNHFKRDRHPCEKVYHIWYTLQAFDLSMEARDLMTNDFSVQKAKEAILVS